MLKKLLFFLLAFSCFTLVNTSEIQAVEGEVLGVHILQPYELDDASALLKTENQDQWHYLTIPLTLNDLNKQAEWQDFFNQCSENKLIPIVRLATRVEDASWQVPNRKEITDLIGFLSDLEWPTDQKHIIVFNEVNHAKEWGGKIDPESYLRVLRFTSDWAHTEQKNYLVLPAAMDLAAPNGSSTMEAFTYLNKLYELDNEVFASIDAWNSHSYPNPGFSSAPTRTSKNSLRGFEHELAYLKQKTDKDYQVYITETGWVANRYTMKWLENYYTYALQHIWSNPAVVAVTPFTLRGAPGPFAAFSFIDGNGNKTLQYEAFQNSVKNVQKQKS